MLDAVEAVASCEAFDGGDGLAVGEAGGREAGGDGLAVEEHRAGAALAFATAILGSSEAEILAEDIEKRAVGGGGELVGFAVNSDRHITVSLLVRWVVLKDGLFEVLGGALKLDAVAIGVVERGDPETVSHIGAFGGNSASLEIAIEGDGVGAEDADGNALPARARRIAFLEHEGDAIEFEPAPADAAGGAPVFGEDEAKAFAVEAKRDVDIGDLEKRNGEGGNVTGGRHEGNDIDFWDRTEECKAYGES